MKLSLASVFILVVVVSMDYSIDENLAFYPINLSSTYISLYHHLPIPFARRTVLLEGALCAWHFRTGTMFNFLNLFYRLFQYRLWIFIFFLNNMDCFVFLLHLIFW